MRKALRRAACCCGARFAARAIAVVFVLIVAASALGCGGSSVGSIGAVLSRNRDTGAVHVREVPEGLAAARAGLMTGDRVKMIDGLHVDEVSKQQLRALLYGPVGSRVTITVIRGEQVLHIELTRTPAGPAEPLPNAEERIE